jgi:hypothetical protein
MKGPDSPVFTDDDRGPREAGGPGDSSRRFVVRPGVLSSFPVS